MKQTKKTFVLDCSMAMAWCFEDETTSYSEAVLDLLETHQAIVPAIWFLEVGNVLLVAERRKRLSSEQAIAFKSALTALPIVADDSPAIKGIHTIFDLAKQHNLSTYDAAYLEVAYHHKLPIATLDNALKKAAIAMKIEIV